MGFKKKNLQLQDSLPASIWVSRRKIYSYKILYPLQYGFQEEKSTATRFSTRFNMGFKKENLQLQDSLPASIWVSRRKIYSYKILYLLQYGFQEEKSTATRFSTRFNMGFKKKIYSYKILYPLQYGFQEEKSTATRFSTRFNMGFKKKNLQLQDSLPASIWVSRRKIYSYKILYPLQYGFQEEKSTATRFSTRFNMGFKKKNLQLQDSLPASIWVSRRKIYSYKILYPLQYGFQEGKSTATRFSTRFNMGFKKKNLQLQDSLPASIWVSRRKIYSYKILYPLQYGFQEEKSTATRFSTRFNMGFKKKNLQLQDSLPASIWVSRRKIYSYKILYPLQYGFQEEKSTATRFSTRFNMGFKKKNLQLQDSLPASIWVSRRKIYSYKILYPLQYGFQEGKSTATRFSTRFNMGFKKENLQLQDSLPASIWVSRRKIYSYKILYPLQYGFQEEKSTATRFSTRFNMGFKKKNLQLQDSLPASIWVSRRKIYSYKILYPLQYGFQEGKSTELAINALLNKVTGSLDSKMKAYCQGFDILNHNILLKKLDH